VDECKPLEAGIKLHMDGARIWNAAAALGTAVQVDPIKPTLKAPGTQRLKLRYNKLLSSLPQSCFQFQLAPLQLGCSPARAVQAADSVSVCLSKGLGAPVGTIVLGDAAFIHKARRLRKACGGAMRQVGVLAAAALMALKEIHPVIHLDHVRMNELATGLGKVDGLKAGAYSST
jgi:threonine aldolase